jgi:hypothetical protein
MHKENAPPRKRGSFRKRPKIGKQREWNIGKKRGTKENTPRKRVSLRKRPKIRKQRNQRKRNHAPNSKQNFFGQGSAESDYVLFITTRIYMHPVYVHIKAH